MKKAREGASEGLLGPLSKRAASRSRRDARAALEEGRGFQGLPGRIDRKRSVTCLRISTNYRDVTENARRVRHGGARMLASIRVLPDGH